MTSPGFICWFVYWGFSSVPYFIASFKSYLCRDNCWLGAKIFSKITQKYAVIAHSFAHVEMDVVVSLYHMRYKKCSVINDIISKILCALTRENTFAVCFDLCIIKNYTFIFYLIMILFFFCIYYTILFRYFQYDGL